MNGSPVISARQIAAGYGARRVLHEISLDIHKAEFVAIIGPNACGKSTLVKALSRLIPLQSGEVQLDQIPLTQLSNRQIARRISVLPQAQVIPPGVRVGEFISRGRYAYQAIFKQWSQADEDAVMRAIELCGVEQLLDRRVDELSGGQRQRVWMAVVLAQDAPTVLLDEPTTFLDLTHQLNLLDLCHELHVQGRTVVAVLHDLSQAARFANRLVCMEKGRIVADGPPQDVLTSELLRSVFSIDATVILDPIHHTPHVIAHNRVEPT